MASSFCLFDIPSYLLIWHIEPRAVNECAQNIPAMGYCRLDTKVLFEVLFWELDQAQLAGAGDGFGAAFGL